MRVRVKQGTSVCYKGVWYNQAEEIEVEDVGNLKDHIELVDIPKQKTKKEEG